MHNLVGVYDSNSFNEHDKYVRFPKHILKIYHILMNKFFTFIVSFEPKSQLDWVNIDVKLIFTSGILITCRK